MTFFIYVFLGFGLAAVHGIQFHRWGGNGWYPHPHGPPPPPPNNGGNFVPYTPNNNVAVGYPTAYSLGSFGRPGGNEQQGSANTSNRQLVRCINGGAHIGHCRLDDDSICIALGGTCVNSVCCTTPFMSLSTTPAPTKPPHIIDGDAYQPKVRSSSEEDKSDASKSRKQNRSDSTEDKINTSQEGSIEVQEKTTFRPKPRSRKPTTTTMIPYQSGSAESEETTMTSIDGSVENTVKPSTIDEERLFEIDELSRLLELGRKSGLTTDSPIFNVFAGLFEKRQKTTTPTPMPMWPQIPGGQIPMFPVFPEWFNRFTMPPTMPMPIITSTIAPQTTITPQTTIMTTTRKVPKIVQIFPKTTTTTERPKRLTTTSVNSIEASVSNESGAGISEEESELDNYHRKTCDSGTRPIGPCTKSLSCPVDHSCEAGGICCYDYTLVLKRMRLAPSNKPSFEFLEK